jgi:rRNA maturation RNase YbeY
MGILIHHNHTGYPVPDDSSLVALARHILSEEDQTPGDVNFILTSNQEILELNRQYLDHDYFTDVIAFHYGETRQIEGDIFISLDKVGENARDYEKTFENELTRVFIHGLLHLTGYRDKTDEQRETMRALEDRYLQQYYLKFR